MNYLNFVLNLVKDLSFKDWLFVIILALIGYISYLKAVQIPNREEAWDTKYNELVIQYEDLLEQINQPPTITLKKGEEESVEIADTSESTLEGTIPQQMKSVSPALDSALVLIEKYTPPVSEKKEPSEDSIKTYTSHVEDTLITGTIKGVMVGPGYIKSLGLTYRLKKPIYLIKRVDTLIKTKTITLTKWRDRDPKWYFNAGGFVSWNQTLKQPGIGPKILAISPELTTYSASWDVVNNAYLIGVTFNF